MIGLLWDSVRGIELLFTPDFHGIMDGNGIRIDLAITFSCTHIPERVILIAPVRTDMIIGNRRSLFSEERICGSYLEKMADPRGNQRGMM